MSGFSGLFPRLGIVRLLVLRVQIVTKCRYCLFGRLNFCLRIFPAFEIGKLRLIRE
jgi:hypothetical protein